MARRQELHLGIAGEPDTIDPARASWDSQAVIPRQVFEGLVGFNPDLTLRPVVAAELPSITNAGVAPDQRTFIFRLRKDRKWADGRPVTARDFEYSLKRLLSPGLAAEYAPLFFAIEGAQEYNSARPSDSRLNDLRERVAVKALDDYSLQFTLVEPWAAFPQVLALWPALPVRQDIVEQHGSKWTSPATYIGNGPFRLSEWSPQQQITLVPSEAYTGERPRLQKIIFSMANDPRADLDAYRRGDRDIIALRPAQAAQVANGPLSKEIIYYPDLATFGLRLNKAKPPFNNLLVRRALAMSIDRETLASQIVGPYGRAAFSWVPPGTPGHNPQQGQEYRLNSTAARQALAEAAATPGQEMPPIVITSAAGEAGARMGEALKAQVEKNLGLSIERQEMNSRSLQNALLKGEYQMVWFGWAANYPDPDPQAWMRGLFTDNGSGSTLTGTPVLDDLARRARVEREAKDRLRLWGQWHQILVEDASTLFLYHRQNLALAKPYVKGLQPTAMDGAYPGHLFYSKLYLAD